MLCLDFERLLVLIVGVVCRRVEIGNVEGFFVGFCCWYEMGFFLV